MKKDRILEIMEKTNLFSLKEQRGHILNFSKKKQQKLKSKIT